MEIKSVILLLDSLPAGLKANIAAVLGMSLAHYYPELVGGPATTACGRELPGITTIPVPILSADETVLSEIYLTASDLDLVVPFGTAALTTKTYDDYCTRLGALTDDDQGVKGLLLYGPKKSVDKLVGQLPLLR
ncbi:DUF2000 domain-containing protein [Paracoccus sp. (in: a-proteobacteria)]|uniref:DUF2000 domain-containing protein n=1 Tax=Paracoccus sp. TaxID=267 RepID=UPI0035AFD859